MAGKMARKLTEEEILKLVQLYGEHECLWDIKSPNYRTKEMRTDDATALKNITQQINIEGFTPTEVKKKIKAIRATYYLEVDKIRKSTRSGASGDVYVPKVKWFKELDAFIKNVTVKRKTMDNSETSHDDADFAEAEDVDEEVENDENYTEVGTSSAHTPARNSGKASSQSSNPRSKRSKLSQMAAMIKDMKSVSNDINMSPSVEDTDFDIFGKHVAAQMKKLSEEQSVIAQEEIQKVLSKCRLADIRKKNNANLYPNTPQYCFTPSPATTTSSNSSLGLYSPEPNETTVSSHNSMTFYLPESVENTRSNSSLEFHPSDRTSMGPTFVDPSRVIITPIQNNRTIINDNAVSGSNSSATNMMIMRAYDNA